MGFQDSTVPVALGDVKTSLLKKSLFFSVTSNIGKSLSGITLPTELIGSYCPGSCPEGNIPSKLKNIDPIPPRFGVVLLTVNIL